MKATVTVRLDDDVNQQLTEAAEALGRSRNDIVQDALRRQLSVLRFETLREQVMPFAETRRVLRDKLGVSADTVKDIERFLRRHHVEPTPEADPPVSVCATPTMNRYGQRPLPRRPTSS
jgi:predicted transcriptional regulator